MPRDFLPAVSPSDQPMLYDTGFTEENLFNCMPHMLANGEVGASPRPNFKNSSQFSPNNSADRGRGLASYGGEIDLYLDQTTYFYNGGSTDLTDTSSPGYAGNTGFNEEYTATFVRHLVSGVENLVIVNAGHTSTHASAKHGNIWYAADASSAPASISDANMPGNNGVSLVRGGASLDGYFFAGDITGKIYNSDLNDITAWSGDFLTAERQPDTLVYVGRHTDHVFALGTRSLEFFYNAGNASGSPLARRQDVSYSIGCYYPNSIVEIGDVVYFVGTDHAGWSRVYMLSGFQLTAISTPKIEDHLRRMTGTFPDITALDALMHSVWLAYVTVGDSPGLVLSLDNVTSSTFGASHYWSERHNKWCGWRYGATVTYEGGIVSSLDWNQCLPIVASNGTAWGVGASAYSRYQFTNGVITYEDPPRDSAIADAGATNAPPVFILFPRWDAGTGRKKKINWVRLVWESRADSINGLTDNIDVGLRWFDYNALVSVPQAPNDFSTARSIDITVNRGGKWGRIGFARERQFLLEFLASAGKVCVVKGLEIDYEIVGE